MSQNIEQRVPLVLLMLSLSGCGTTVNKTFLANGEEGYAIDCSSAYAETIDCYEQAGKTCGSRGYEVLATGDIGLASRGMLIKCK